MRVTVSTTFPAGSLTAYADAVNCSVLPMVANGTTCEYTRLVDGKCAALPP